jgi:hypothetical protein
LSEAFANVISGAVALNVYVFVVIVPSVRLVRLVVDVLNFHAVTANFTVPSITSSILPTLAITFKLIVASFSTARFISFTTIFPSVSVVSRSNVASISSSFSTFTNLKFPSNKFLISGNVAHEATVAVKSNDFTVILSFAALIANLATS